MKHPRVLKFSYIGALGAMGALSAGCSSLEFCWETATCVPWGDAGAGDAQVTMQGLDAAPSESASTDGGVGPVHSGPVESASPSEPPLDAGEVDSAVRSADDAGETSASLDASLAADSADVSAPPELSDGGGVDAAIPLSGMCELGEHNCSAHATCTDTALSFTCACNHGFVGDGVNCSPRVTSVAAGGNHTCATIGEGTVRCWGQGLYGQLGYGDNENNGDMGAPKKVDVAVGGSVKQLALGTSHTCALLESGGVRCWGRNNEGQLGTGDKVDLNEPPAIDIDVGGEVIQVAAGSQHTCALLASGGVRCWGSDLHGSLGYGDEDSLLAPKHADIDLGVSAKQIAVGAFHGCALLVTNSVRCWGWGSMGQVGYGSNQDYRTPGLDVDVGGSVRSVVAGSYHTCAVLSTGDVKCWGYGEYGQLGYANSSALYSPVDEYVQIGGAVASLAGGELHTCALLDGGTVRCWGSGGYGKLGYGNERFVGLNDSPFSAGDVDVGGQVEQITTGANHTCALLTSGALRCWGQGGDGQLGYGDNQNVGDIRVPALAGNVPLL